MPKKKKKKKRKRYSNKIFKYGRKREHWSIIVDQFALTSPKLAWPVSLACCWALTWPCRKHWQIKHFRVKWLTSVNWWLALASAANSSACCSTDSSEVENNVWSPWPCMRFRFEMTIRSSFQKCARIYSNHDECLKRDYECCKNTY